MFCSPVNLATNPAHFHEILRISLIHIVFKPRACTFTPQVSISTDSALPSIHIGTFHITYSQLSHVCRSVIFISKFCVFYLAAIES